jgi:hypothetical protein
MLLKILDYSWIGSDSIKGSRFEMHYVPYPLYMVLELQYWYRHGKTIIFLQTTFDLHLKINIKILFGFWTITEKNRSCCLIRSQWFCFRRNRSHINRMIVFSIIFFLMLMKGNLKYTIIWCTILCVWNKYYLQI